MFVVPCRFDPARPVIFECIEAIQRHHADANILVIDSDSPDREYMDWCAERGCAVADIHNHGYATGAFSWAVRNYPADFYYFMFDSLIAQSNLDHMRNNPLTVIRHWHCTQHDWGWDQFGVHLSEWGGEQLDRMGVPRTTNYHGIMGPMMFMQRAVADQLAEMGYWDTQVTTVWLQCAMERVAGIVFEHLGYDVTQSLQGTLTVHHAQYNEEFVKKYDLSRS